MTIPFFDGRETTRPHTRASSEGAIRRRRFAIPFFSRTSRRSGAYPHCLYWSFHTTAGFLDRSLAARLSAERIPGYVDAFRALFPEGAGYAHDSLERRGDLDPAQRAVEPRNADSHLAFIAGGLRTSVMHPNRDGEEVCWIDLDGMNHGKPRRRLTRLIAFHRERVVRNTRIEVPVSAHPIDSINLKDPRLGIYAQLTQFVKDAGLSTGRLRIALDPVERHSALTVNEYETLLMRHDLAEVLRNPLRFVAEKSRHALANPFAVPARTLDYAKYDLVRVLNKGLDAFGLRGSIIEKVMARTLAVPAARFFRMRRSVSLLVSAGDDGAPTIVEGMYQSPILVQWQHAPRQSRVLDVTLTEIKSARLASRLGRASTAASLSGISATAYAMTATAADGPRHFLRQDAIDGVRRRVVDHEVARGISDIRHRRDSAGLGDGTDVSAAASRCDLGKVQRLEQQTDLSDHGARRHAAGESERRRREHSEIRFEREHMIGSC